MLQAIAGRDPDDPTTSRRAGAGLSRPASRRGRAGCGSRSRPTGSMREVDARGRDRRRAVRCGPWPRPACRRGRCALTAVRPAQRPAPGGDAGRVRGLSPRAGAGAAAATTTRRPWRGWSPASRCRASTTCAPCPRAGRCWSGSAPRCFADADVLALPATPGGDAAHRGHGHRRRRPLRRGRQPPGRAGRPDQLSGAAGAQPAGRPRRQRACRSACSWWRGRSPRRCCCAWPTPSSRRPDTARNRRRSRAGPEPCRSASPRPASCRPSCAAS